MPAPSPTLIAGEVASFQIQSNGEPLRDSFQVLSIDIWTGVNRVQKARLVLADGDAATGSFPISASDALVPGRTLEISLGYDANVSLVFRGKIYRHALDIAANAVTQLIVEAADGSIAMSLARRNAVHTNIGDDDLLRSLISSAGLTAEVAGTTITHPTIVQYDSTDWDFMLMRAQANGMVVTAANGTVKIAPPNTSQAPTFNLVYGDSILEFHAGIDAATQSRESAVSSVAWDPSTQQVTKSDSARAPSYDPGNITAETLAEVFTKGTVLQQTAATLSHEELKAWSSAELMMSRLAKIRGQVTFQGTAKAVADSMITLGGLSDRFNGNGYVSGVHHHVAEGNYRTTVELGLSPNWFADTAFNIAAPAAAGLLPAANGLHTGLVTKIDQDPEGEYRVQVTFPLLEAQGAVWARLAGFYASNGFGAQFYPEVGDEVVVAFMNCDPRYPVILGSVYSKTRSPPNAPEPQNAQKSVVTSSKLRIDFYEDKKAIEVRTPSGRKFRLDDEAGKISLEDPNGNTIAMSSNGISLSSNGEINLSAATITQKATATFSAQGSASVSVNSDGPVQVKGLMVNLNP